MKYTYDIAASSNALENVLDKTVVIVAHDGDETIKSSGFIVSDTGYILTAYHVIDHILSSNVFVSVRGEFAKYHVSIVSVNKKKDLALLKMTTLPSQKLKYFNIAECSNVNVGMPVFSAGAPEGLNWTVTKGIISCASRIMDDVEYIQYDAAISQGSSGGPVVNSECDVVTMNLFMVPDSTSKLNFGPTTKTIRTFLKDNHVKI